MRPESPYLLNFPQEFSSTTMSWRSAMVVRMTRQLPASEVNPVLLSAIFQRYLCTSELVFRNESSLPVFRSMTLKRLVVDQRAMSG